MSIKVKEVLEKLTLHEKASLCSGYDFWTTKPITRLNIPSVVMADGPHGLRKENNDDTDNVAMKASFPATSFPPAVNMASTWNTSLIHKVGVALGEQCLNQGIDVILGPGTNIKRSPLCGRNFEYFSEDPFLAGNMCVEYIKGVQSTGTGTSLKHFAVNSQEYLRMTINEVVDERSFREMYLTSFEMAVKESNPTTVMCSYNLINNVYASDNKRLLTQILREEWGFEGLVVSDWNAVNNRIAGIKAGMDLEMPSCGGKTDKEIVNAVLSGELLEKELDTVVERILNFIDKSIETRDEGYFYNYRTGHRLARKVADESMVLLKNNDNLLPLDYSHEIAVIGALANTPRYQGSGSSRINPFILDNFIEYLESHKLTYAYAEGYTLTNDGYDENLFNQAVELAKTRDKVIVFAGLTDSYESEGFDRAHLDIPSSHNKLIEEICKHNKNVIVILFGGSPVEMPWLDKVNSVLNAYLPGEAGGSAIADIIYGIVNPSGKLAETYPIKLEDYIGSQYYKGGPKNVEHREGIYIGYRYYDTAKKEVLFPFGYGMSYTTFEYSNLKINKQDFKDSDNVIVKFDVTNTGKVDGSEICQLYVRDVVSTIFKADKELKGFSKVFVKAGETKSVTLHLNKRSFSYFNTTISDWHVESGDYEIIIGASSRDIRLNQIINVVSTDKDVDEQDLKAILPTYYNIADAKEIPSEEFIALHKISDLIENRPSRRGEFDKNTTVGEMRCCLVGKIFMKLAPVIIKGQMPNADLTTMLMIQQGMVEMPMRALNGVTSGLLDDKVIEGLLLWGNRKRLKGLCKMISGLIKSALNVKKVHSNDDKISLEKREFREEQLRLKEEHKAYIMQQRQELKELRINLEELKKLRSSALLDKQYDKINEYIEKQESSIAKQKQEIDSTKEAKKENLENFRARKKDEMKTTREEARSINKALRNYANDIDKDNDLAEDKKSALNILISKFKSSDDGEDVNK